MNNVEKRVAFYEQRRNDIMSGKVKPIPFFGLPQLTKYIPGIIPGMMYKITSHSGMGKTQFAKFAFVYQPVFYAIKYKVNLQILYFALEESEEEFIDGLFMHILQRVMKKPVDRFALAGNSTTALTQDELDAIKIAKSHVQTMMTYIKIVDDCYTPDSIYNKCKYFAGKMGKFNIDAITNEEQYIPNDPSQSVLVICDHISLIEEQYDKETESFLNHSKSIAKWHTKYARKIITKKWKWACLNIQQQSLESERQQFTNKGETVINKILPSLDGLANNKEVGRDDYITLGLFAPERYDLDEFRGFNIKNKPNSFGDNFRSLHVLKNRLGVPNKVLPLFFDGSYTYFEELPKPSESIKLDKFYKLLK